MAENIPENGEENENGDMLSSEILTPDCSTNDCSTEILKESVGENAEAFTDELPLLKQGDQPISNGLTEITNKENIQDMDLTKTQHNDAIESIQVLSNEEKRGLEDVSNSSTSSSCSENLLEGKAVDNERLMNFDEDTSPFFHRSKFSPQMKYRLKCQCGAKKCRKYLY